MKKAGLYTPLNAGIWSPLLHGRADLAKYPAAAADCHNLIPMVLGGITRRPGTHDIAGTHANMPAMLGRFVFNEDQAYALEWTPHALRFIERGALIQAGPAPYRLDTPYGAADLASIRSAQSADIVYLACPTVRPHKLSRYGRTDWTLTPVVFRDGPYRDPWPDMPAVTLVGDTMTFAAAVATPDWVGQCIRFQIDGKWYWRRVTAVASPTSITAIVEPGAAVPGLTGETQASFSVVVNADGSNGTLIPLPAAWQPVLSADNLRVTIGTLSLTAGLHFTVEGGAVVRLTQPAAAHVTITIVNSILAAAPVDVVTGMIAAWRAPAWGGDRGWPSSVALFEQRTWWAAPTAEPLSVWASVTGDYETFSPTEEDGTVTDDDGLYLIAADQEVAQIRWLMPGQTLGMGTAGAEYQIRASDISEALTPANANIRPATSEGSAAVEPLRIDDVTVFGGRNGKSLHLLAYDAQQDGMVAPDAAQLADETIDAGIIQLAWCGRPHRLLWVALADGTLASLTYAPRDAVTAWARHTVTGAQVLSIVSVPEPNGDALYMVTRRMSGGLPSYRLERMADRWRPARGETDARRALYLDAARTVTGHGLTSVTGLYHLESQLVRLLVDGAEQPAQIVTGGTVTLDMPGDLVHVGLAIPYRLETLDIDQGGPIGTGQGRPKSVTGLQVLVYATAAADIRLIVDDIAQKPAALSVRQASQPSDKALRLVSKWVPVALPNAIGASIRLVLEGESPLPATLLGMAVQLQTNEG